jgi:lipopolysaccharide export system permease protein
MRTLDRLVLWTFFKLWLVCLLAVPPLFIIGDFTENLDRYLDRGLTRAEIGQSYLYKLPEYFQFAFPIAALVATVFTIHGMTRHREIVAAKAGGVSFHRLVAPLVVLGALLTIAALGLSELVPRGNRIAAQIQQAEAPRRSWRSDFVYRSENGLNWQVRRLTASDGRMTGLTLERPPTKTEAGLHVTAEAAGWTEGEGWLLVRGYMRTLGPDSTEQALEFDRLVIPAMTERIFSPPQPIFFSTISTLFFSTPSTLFFSTISTLFLTPLNPFSQPPQPFFLNSYRIHTPKRGIQKVLSQKNTVAPP